MRIDRTGLLISNGWTTADRLNALYRRIADSLGFAKSPPTYRQYLNRNDVCISFTVVWGQAPIHPWAIKISTIEFSISSPIDNRTISRKLRITSPDIDLLELRRLLSEVEDEYLADCLKVTGTYIKFPQN